MSTSRVLRTTAAVVLAVALGAVLGAAMSDRDHRAAPILTPLETGFAQDMSGHHQQAVTMTDMLAADASPEVKALAEQIRFTQLAEIGQMTGWLQLAGAATTSARPMEWMAEPGGGHHEHPMAMSGMASPGELAELAHSTGRDNEALFLHLMTRHHQGGVAMAGYAFRHVQNDAVRRAAGVMVAEQTEEIALMTLMLDARDGAH